MLFTLSPRPLVAGAPPLESVSLPEGEGQVLAPAGWSREPATQAACGGLAPAENGLASSHPLDYTLVLRALRWTAGRAALEQVVEACGAGAGRGARAAGTSGPQYALRFARLGVPIEARGILLSREGESLLLELEGPVATMPIVEGLYDRWVREVAGER